MRHYAMTSPAGKGSSDPVIASNLKRLSAAAEGNRRYLAHPTSANDNWKTYQLIVFKHFFYFHLKGEP
jgi:hypothetical protein